MFDIYNETTTTAREGIQTLGTVCAEPVCWDAAESMPAEYESACMGLTAETLTRADMLVLGVLGDTDLVSVEDGDVCVGRVAPLPSQLINTTKEALEETVSDACKELPLAYLSAAVAATAVTGAESVRCDALTFRMEPSQARMRVCHVNWRLDASLASTRDFSQTTHTRLDRAPNGSDAGRQVSKRH